MCHSVLLVGFFFVLGVGFFGGFFWVFFAGPDINLGLMASISIISHQQHGESEKRN